jgi:hypothetical protein
MKSDGYTLFGDGRAGVGWGNESIELDILYFCYSDSVHLGGWNEPMNVSYMVDRSSSLSIAI